MSFKSYDKLLKSRTHESVVEAGKQAEKMLDKRHPSKKADYNYALYADKSVITEPGKVDTTLTKGVLGVSALVRLPYFNIVDHTLPDMMHLVQGVIGRHLLGCIAGTRLVQAAKRKELALYKAQLKADGADEERIKASVALYQKQVAAAKKTQRRAVKAKKGTMARQGLFVNIPARHVLGVDANQAAAASLELQEVDLQGRKATASAWHIGDSALELIEEICYKSIRAPPGVAPHNLKPLTVPTNLTCAQWCSFSKVYGKYLFMYAFLTLERQKILEACCDLLQFVNICLASVHTPTSIKELFLMQSKLAEHIKLRFPDSEKSAVLHILVHHMPAFIKQWGPVRDYWCFAFER